MTCVTDVDLTAQLEKAVSLKPEQENAIKELVKGVGHNVFVCLTSGFGKSLCYIILPMLFDIFKRLYFSIYSIVLIVSPLNAIITDQVKSLTCMKGFAGCSCEE